MACLLSHFDTCGSNQRLRPGQKVEDLEFMDPPKVRAALWVARQEPGYYSMKDVLGLKD